MLEGDDYFIDLGIKKSFGPIEFIVPLYQSWDDDSLIKNKKALLIGGSGNLGSSIIKSGLFENLHCPQKKNLNILDRNSIGKYSVKINLI